MFKKNIFVVFVLVLFFGCTQSGRRKTDINNSRVTDKINDRKNQSFSNERIKMRKEGGVYYVPIEINGVDMEFIFDTGASDITLSTIEADFLRKQGKLRDSDFIGVKQYEIANGEIMDGTLVNLREVKIGNKTIYNIEASIVHNQSAPLLFGQSAMNKFGKITIDYNRNEVTFN